MCAVVRSIYNDYASYLLYFFKLRTCPSGQGNFLELLHWSFLSLCSSFWRLPLCKYWTYLSGHLILLPCVKVSHHLVLPSQILSRFTFRAVRWHVTSTAVVFIPGNLLCCCSLNVPFRAILLLFCGFIIVFYLSNNITDSLVVILVCFVFWYCFLFLCILLCSSCSFLFLSVGNYPPCSNFPSGVS